MNLLTRLSLILICVSFVGNLHAQTPYGNWFVGKIEGDDGFYAATLNDSKGIFGQYCYVESDVCLWLLATDVDCKEGSKYPALINADGGSEQLELICNKLGKKPRYLFSNFERIDAVVSTSKTYIGIAFPLESGLFQVTRFLLDGSQEAIQDMYSRMKQRGKSKKSNGTKNYKM
jgi:hypothetical protein